MSANADDFVTLAVWAAEMSTTSGVVRMCAVPFKMANKLSQTAST